MSNTEDVDGIFELYKNVSKNAAGLARIERRITGEYVQIPTDQSIQSDLQLIITDKGDEQKVVAEIRY